MSSFVVTRISKSNSVVVPKVKSLANVDIRPKRTESAKEKNALMISLKSFGVELGADLVSRFVTVVNAGSIQEASRIASNNFDEALNSYFLNWKGIEAFGLTDCGYIRNLTTGDVEPILKESSIGTQLPMFMVASDRYAQIEVDQWLSIYKHKSTLAQALNRSLHWRRIAFNEDKEELKFLFNWISIEALTKLSEFDDVSPRIMLALGFPTSSSRSLIKVENLRRLSSHTDYRFWYDWILSEIKEMKNYRNDVVHSGFRLGDLSPQKMRRFNAILKYAVPRIQGLVEAGYIKGIFELKELWEYGPIIKEELRFIEDVHGTIIYLLNDEFRR